MNTIDLVNMLQQPPTLAGGIGTLVGFMLIVIVLSLELLNKPRT